MSYAVLVLGGYGNFGSRISRLLAVCRDISLIVAGRNENKARAFAASLNAEFGCDARGVALDINDPGLSDLIAKSGARLVIHTSGPFQGQAYHVARACVRAGVNYVDLADDRAFVTGIGNLDEEARRSNLLVVSGASSVPGLSSAVIDHYLPRFKTLTSVDFGISPGNRTERGIATVRSILSYTGRPFLSLRDGQWKSVHGWQEIRRYWFDPTLGHRWLANCDIPDLQLFPGRYPSLRTVRFQAGLELGFLHVGLWLLSWLSRVGLIRNWSRYAAPITTMSRWFQKMGTDTGGMFVRLKGEGLTGEPLTIDWVLSAGRGDGPYIPGLASVLLAKKLAAGKVSVTGAMPCMGLLTLDDFVREMQPFDIRCTETIKRV